MLKTQFCVKNQEPNDYGTIQCNSENGKDRGVGIDPDHIHKEPTLQNQVY